WQRLTMREAIQEYWPPEAGAKPADTAFESAQVMQARLHAAIDSLGQQIRSRDPLDPVQHEENRGLINLKGNLDLIRSMNQRSGSAGKTTYALFELLVEPNLIQPTFIYDYP